MTFSVATKRWIAQLFHPVGFSHEFEPLGMLHRFPITFLFFGVWSIPEAFRPFHREGLIGGECKYQILALRIRNLLGPSFCLLIKTLADTASITVFGFHIAVDHHKIKWIRILRLALFYIPMHLRDKRMFGI